MAKLTSLLTTFSFYHTQKSSAMLIYCCSQTK